MEPGLESAIQNLRIQQKEQHQNAVASNSESLNCLVNRLEEASAQWKVTAGGPTRSIAFEIVDIVISSPANDVTICWLAHLLLEQKLLDFKEPQLSRLLQWLGTALKTNGPSARASLAAIGYVLKGQSPELAGHYLERLFHPSNSLVLAGFEQSEGAWQDETNVAIVQCIDVVLGCLLETELVTRQMEVCQLAAIRVLNVHYIQRPATTTFTFFSTFALSSLSLLLKIVTLCPQYAREHGPELLGLGRAYMHYCDDVDTLPPSPIRVHASLQSLYDSAEDAMITEVRNTGGKVSKTRKPRAVVKGARQPSLGTNQLLANDIAGVDLRTSDSDASEPENATNRRGQQWQRRVKVRLAAISLVGVVARLLERRVLYSYWHSLFPSTNGDGNDDLVHIGQHDPSLRCRCAALQVAAQLLHGSRRFLSVAESSDALHPTSSFLPHGQSLGYSVLSTYESLTAILAAESSLPVLTQALKCLAVLVQATTFQRLKPGVVERFVQHVRPLLQHRDSTIQVSALMVLEFLIAPHQLTPEIAQAVSLPHHQMPPFGGNRHDYDAAELLDGEETFAEYVELDEAHNFSGASVLPTTATAPPVVDATCGEEPTWLQERVFKNLECTAAGSKVSIAVRIGSFQVLSAMVVHFRQLQGAQLDSVAEALANTLLLEPLADVRLYAARCLDSYAYQISQRLLDMGGNSATEIAMCERFWLRILPVVMEQIGSFSSDDIVQEQAPAIKVCLCDALSNIGVVIFDRLAHTTQMVLLSFVSGLSSDPAAESTVHAAAVRVLAVLVFFPSLRGNLVFVENTAELALRLINDDNLHVRVKASWALGNMSDALLLSVDTPERISDDLLRRLIEAATTSCTDNDKIRCNAVRSQGNLLRLLNEEQLSDPACRKLFQRAISKLIHCIRCGGTAKVKWNACYALGNILRNRALFIASAKHGDLDWQGSLFAALANVIVHHPNFKVRINAAAAVVAVNERAHYGQQFETVWRAVLVSIEQSHNLLNFYEYNHRDQLQEHLCLAVCHLIGCAAADDLPSCAKLLARRLEVVGSTWGRVTNRMVPEKAAPLISCSMLLQDRFKNDTQLTPDQRNALAFIAQSLAVYESTFVHGIAFMPI